MDKEPLLSIITINYNNKAGLENTFKSIFNQTWQEFEYIVIDGGSTDGSKKLIEQNQDKIDYWISESDKGIYNAMNKGIRVAKGKYLNFMNSGDCFYDLQVLQKCYGYLETDKSIYFANFFNKLQNKITYLPKELSLRNFLFGSISHQSSFIKKSLFYKYFFYNEQYKIVSDWEFFIRIIFQFNESYQHIPKVISIYEDDGISSLNVSKSVRLLHDKERATVLNKYFSNYMEDYVYLEEAIYFVKLMRKIGVVQFLRYVKLLKII